MHRLAAGLITLLAALPATSNYQLNSYSFSSGGTANSTTSTYALEGTTGEISGKTGSTANYNLKPGFIETQQANIPKIATFDNGSGTYYNYLQFTLDTQGNPSDALYALQISTDNFVSDIRYVKSDHTVGSSLTLADYQTYSAWGGAFGAYVSGLTPTTTYYLRAKATQGKYTESAYGPALSASTVGPQLSFSLSPNSVDMGSLLPGVIAAQSFGVNFTTNAPSGGDVYISGQNSGLSSVRTGFTIDTVTGDLSALTRGFGAQAIFPSPGVLAAVSPYDQSGSGRGATDKVGPTDTTIRRIMTASQPVPNGSGGSVNLEAKAAANDPAAPDYKEVLTMLASASF